MLKGKRVMIYIWSGAGAAAGRGTAATHRTWLSSTQLFCLRRLGGSGLWVPSTPAAGSAASTRVVGASLYLVGWAEMDPGLQGAAAGPSRASLCVKPAEDGKGPLKLLRTITTPAPLANANTYLQLGRCSVKIRHALFFSTYS